MQRALASLGLLAALLALPGLGCSAADRGGAAGDPRVRTLLGTTPPEIAGEGRWLNAPPASLAALRGQVVFLQFSFPT